MEDQENEFSVTGDISDKLANPEETSKAKKKKKNQEKVVSKHVVFAHKIYIQYPQCMFLNIHVCQSHFLLNFQAWASKQQLDAGLFTPQSRPEPLNEMYNKCDQVPAVSKMQVK